MLKLVGKIIDDRYSIEEKIGKLSSYKRAYRARRVKLGDIVAFKIVHGPIASGVPLEEEARRILDLKDHPGIVNVYDIGEFNGRPYMVEEFVHGATKNVPADTLEDLLKKTEHHFTMEQALSIAAQTADAVAYAHSKGIVHSDLKKQNILLNGDGKVKITDFGLSHIVDPTILTIEEDSALSSYSDSKRAVQEDVTAPVYDILCLGNVLLQLLPKIRIDLVNKSDMITKEKLEKIVNKARAEPNQRYTTIAEAKKELEELLYTREKEQTPRKKFNSIQKGLAILLLCFGTWFFTLTKPWNPIAVGAYHYNKALSRHHYEKISAEKASAYAETALNIAETFGIDMSNSSLWLKGGGDARHSVYLRDKDILELIGKKSGRLGLRKAASINDPYFRRFISCVASYVLPDETNSALKKDEPENIIVPIFCEWGDSAADSYSYFYHTLGCFSFHERYLEDAVLYFKSAAIENPKLAVHHYMLGSAYFELFKKNNRVELGISARKELSRAEDLLDYQFADTLVGHGFEKRGEPRAVVYKKLGDVSIALAESGRITNPDEMLNDAKAAYTAALEISPTYFSAKDALENLEAKLQNTP